MDIEAALAWCFENGLWQKEPIGNDDGGIGLVRQEGLLLRLAFERGRGVDHEIMRQGKMMHRRQALRHAAPGGAGWLRIDGGDLMAGIEQG